ncbi:factor-independent urate hydroxylase [Salsuginibacillus kocurii]|uniref:factor-independent urate hydroxylase n=1 Tax=Salsuginibacillus kocurii TaxID=427078 RepID=UPI000475D980|nr:urate oxidase [Salsuginibacillus kocurii]
MLTIEEVNQMDLKTFSRTFGDIFEDSSWIAVEAYRQKPFASMETLHNEMVHVVKTSDYQDQLALIKAHPNLGTNKKMSTNSCDEQKQAGLRGLTIEENEELNALNKTYMETFDFPFIFAVKGKTKHDIYISLKNRVKNSAEQEFTTALDEIYKIAYFRLVDKCKKGDDHMQDQQAARMLSYGKADVFAYRTFLTPLSGVKQIPESSFSGRDNTVFGFNASIEIGGPAFLSSFTEGDNSLVVATDSMKNFIQWHLGSFEGTTLEGFVSYASEAFLQKYNHVEMIELSSTEVPFNATTTVKDGELAISDLVFNRSRNEEAYASIQLQKTAGGTQIVEQKSGLLNLQLVKVKDNSFTGFIRDEYTTLPEDGNRPLFIYLNLDWRYQDPAQALGDDPSTYVAAEQVRDIATSIFHEMETPSIQALIYEIGCRVLERFPQLTDISFESQNRTWDAVVENIPGSEGKVYTEPRLPYGFQRFQVTQEDVTQAQPQRLTHSQN